MFKLFRANLRILDACSAIVLNLELIKGGDWKWSGEGMEYWSGGVVLFTQRPQRFFTQRFAKVSAKSAKLIFQKLCCHVDRPKGVETSPESQVLSQVISTLVLPTVVHRSNRQQGLAIAFFLCGLCVDSFLPVSSGAQRGFTESQSFHFVLQYFHC